MSKLYTKELEAEVKDLKEKVHVLEESYNSLCSKFDNLDQVVKSLLQKDGDSASPQLFDFTSTAPPLSSTVGPCESPTNLFSRTPTPLPSPVLSPQPNYKNTQLLPSPTPASFEPVICNTNPFLLASPAKEPPIESPFLLTTPTQLEPRAISTNPFLPAAVPLSIPLRPTEEPPIVRGNPFLLATPTEEPPIENPFLLTTPTPLEPRVISTNPFLPAAVPLSTPLRPIGLNIDCSPSFLVNVRARSCSRGNFAANLNRSWYSEEERRTSNVHGKSNKRMLSPRRMNKIRAAVFSMFPRNQKETEKEAWADCVRAIDVSNRALNRKKNKEN